ncbi:MAG: Cu-processing system permease protein [Bradymonadia bacterium]|jgi:Cu-processing system permease protein
MKALLAIARNTFLEAVRNKVLYSIVFFAVGMIGFSALLGSVSLGQDQRVLLDLGLSSLSLFLDMIAIFVGVTMVYQEMQRKSIYNVLSKPIARSTYLCGKYCGVALTLLVQLVIMAIALCCVVYLKGYEPNITLLWAFVLIYVRSLIVAAFAVFFSSFSTPYISGFLVFGVWLVGGLLEDLRAFLSGDLSVDLNNTVSDGISTIGSSVLALAPDLGLFTLTTQIASNIHVPVSYVVDASMYGLSYAGVLILAGTVIFARRDFI